MAHKDLSIVIPALNEAAKIKRDIEAASAFLVEAKLAGEVIVVDDHSSDESRNIIQEYPCHLVSLPQHQGAGYARNAGVKASRGDILFFTDADCVIQKNTLSIVADSMAHLNDKIYDVFDSIKLFEFIQPSLVKNKAIKQNKKKREALVSS